ncbi:MAG: PhzF family phenazine biosynthesis protein [Terracoccus sp.]
MDLGYRLLNVFAIEGDPFSGNPLCVFTDAAALTDEQMQAWARQFNLSESTFVTGLRPADHAADVRIFTASYEMPFAGHPTLGTAHVVAGLLVEQDPRRSAVDDVSIRLPVGPVPVRRTGTGWELTAGSPRHRGLDVSPADLAVTLGIRADQLVEDAARWVDVGVEQLIVQLSDAAAVRACAPVVAAMHRHLTTPERPPHVYVWAWTGEGTAEARLFAVSGSGLEEDPATGSACSNLGGWLVGQGRRDLTVTVSQGAAVSRPSRLDLRIDADGGIHVGGRVVAVGSGTVTPVSET